MNIDLSQKLQDLLTILEDGDMNPKEFNWYLYGGLIEDVNYLGKLGASCFCSIGDRQDTGLTGMDFVLVDEIIEGIIEKAWDTVSKDSGTLVLFSDTDKFNFNKLNVLVTHLLPYEDVGMIVDISKKEYTGILIRKIEN